MNGHDNDGNPVIGYSDTREKSDVLNKLWLGHSCDDWVIGTVEEAKEFVTILNEAIAKAENEPNKPFKINDEY